MARCATNILSVRRSQRRPCKLELALARFNGVNHDGCVQHHERIVSPGNSSGSACFFWCALMSEVATAIFEALWIAGILAFAISGALVGVRHNLDLLGVLVVGISTGIGGGVIRDVILGVHPPVSFLVWPYWVTALLGSLVVFFFHPRLSKIRRFEIVFDAFGLGIFSAYGAAAATAADLDPVTAIFVGTIVSIGGGLIRDVLVNDVPGVLTRELYAVSAIVGASVATVITQFTDNLMIASIVGGVLAISLRLTSYARGWHLPKPRPVGTGPSDVE